jgi:excisionase family DNA binding protein
MFPFKANNKLLSVEDAAQTLEVSPFTVQRWCRDGNLPCLKFGRQWRIRSSVLEGFLRQSERPESLAERLRHFLEVPDNVLAIAQSHELIRKLDTAFFMVADARGGVLAKYYHEDLDSAESLRSDFEREGLEVTRLEEEGRLRFAPLGTLEGERTEALRHLIGEETSEGRSVWASFNWNDQIDLDAALRQQEELSHLVEDSRFVAMTAMLERVVDDWPGTLLREAQVKHSATLWLTESGLALTRVLPPPSGKKSL